MPELTAADFERQLKQLRQQGHFDQARALLQPLAARTAPEGPWARRLLAAHDARWWALPSGRRCRLRRRGPQDLAFVRRLWAAPGFLERFNPSAALLPQDDETLRRILANEQAALLGESRAIHWVIETLAGTPFGVASLADISLAHRRAEFLIGVHEAPYRGAAAEATLLAIDFAFGTMKLAKLIGLVPAGNQPSLEASAHIGFRSEGVLRQHIIDPRTRAPIDIVHMALLADDEAAGARQRRVRQRLLGATSITG